MKIDKKKIIIIITIIVVILLLLFIRKNNKRNSDYNNINWEVNDPINDYFQGVMEKTKGKVQYMTDRAQYYNVKAVINKFLIECYNLHEASDSEKEVNKEAIYNMLSRNYISEMNFSYDNIENLLSYDDQYSIDIYNMYYMTKYENVYTYFVNGFLTGYNTNNRKECNFIVNLDINNYTFEIYLDDYANRYNAKNLENEQEIEFALPDSVEERKANKFTATSCSKEELCRDSIIAIKRMLFYDIETAYNFLSDEAKNEFPTIDLLRNYVESEKVSIYAFSYGGVKTTFDEKGDTILKIYNSTRTMYIDVHFINGLTTYKFNIYKI